MASTTRESRVGENAAANSNEYQREATIRFYRNLVRLLNERRMLSQHVREYVRDARNDGYSSASARLAARLNRMTPEKREKWADELRFAAALFGYEVQSTGEVAEGLDGLKAIVDKIGEREKLKKETDAQIRELKAEARSDGVDVETVAFLARMARRFADREDGDDGEAPIEKWFFDVDAVGTILDLW